jgi:hypothetical protein
MKSCGTCGMSELSAPGPWREFAGQFFCSRESYYGQAMDCLAEHKHERGLISFEEMLAEMREAVA